MTTHSSRWNSVPVILAAAAFYLLLAYVLYSSVTLRAPGANDYYSRWAGARALFLQGRNPYSDSVTQEIQKGMYGRLARPDEDQVAFAYPLYAAFATAPLVGLPYAQAQAFWMAFLVLALLCGIYALFRLNGIPLSPPLLLGLILGALFFYPSVRGIFLGQYALVTFLFLTLAFLAVQFHWDLAAGLLLALATVKPQPAVLLVPAVLIWAVWQRRWRIWAGAGGAFLVLIGGALALVPTWPLDFLQAIRRYSEYEPVGPPIQTLAEWLLPNPWSGLLAVFVGLGLAAALAWRLLRTRNASWSDWQPTAQWAIIVTMLTAGRVGTSDQVLLLIPWVGWMSRWWKDGMRVQTILAFSAILVLPWAAFLSTLQGNAENVGVTLVLPFLTLIVFLWHELGERRIVLRDAPL